MFQTETRTTKNLYLVAGSKERRETTLKGAKAMNTNMNEYRFAEYPSNSTVANGVTLLVSAWFLVAAGAILTDPVSPYTQRPVVTEAAAPAPTTVAAIAPATYFTITVEAKRLKV